MKASIFKTAVLAAVASTAIAMLAVSVPGTSSAADQDKAGSGPRDHGRGHGRGMRGPFTGALRQLDLSAEQKQSIKSVMQEAGQQAAVDWQANQANMAILANPGDPGYAAAVAQAKVNAAAMIQRRSDVAVQIYAMLSPEQQAKLPAVISDMQANMQQRRGKHRPDAPQTAD